MDLELEGRRALVTAASEGLGRAVATRFAAEGVEVAVCSRDAEHLAAAREAIAAEAGVPETRVHTFVCDLSDAESAREQVAGAIDDLGGLDALVANHGGPPAQSFAESSLADFDAAYEGVLRGTVAVCEAALPALLESGGSLTTLVSASAREPPENHVLSNTLRPGLYGLTKSLANEYGDDGLRANCVCPRGVYTDRIDYKIEVLAENEGVSVEEAHERRREELPRGELGDPDNFAKAVVFLASGATPHVTGAVLDVDGGWSRHAF